MRQLHEAPVPPSQRLERAVPADLEALVLRCLAKAPAERPASARALRAELDACQDAGKWTAELCAAWWQQHAGGIALRQRARGPLQVPGSVRLDRGRLRPNG